MRAWRSDSVSVCAYGTKDRACETKMREYRAKGSAHSAKEKCRQGERGWKPVRLSLNVVAGFFFSGDIPGKGKSASVKATEPSVPHPKT